MIFPKEKQNNQLAFSPFYNLSLNCATLGDEPNRATTLCSFVSLTLLIHASICIATENGIRVPDTVFFFLLHAVLIMIEQNNSRKIWLALLSGAFHLSSFVSFDVCRALCRKEMLRTRQSVDAWCCFSQRVINTYNISTRFVSFLTHFSNLVDSNLRIQMRN